MSKIELKIEGFFDWFSDIIIEERNNFICNYMYEPTKIWLDGITYKKLEISTLQFHCNSYSHASTKTDKPKFMGMEIDVLPLPNRFIEVGFKENDKNIDLAMRRVLK